jgi:membrane protein
MNRHRSALDHQPTESGDAAGLDATAESPPAPDDPRKPASPRDLHRRDWRGVLVRTVREFREDNCTDWAAALTYYGILALFPAVIALVSLIGLVGDPQTTTQHLLDIVGKLGPSSAVDTFAKPVESLAQGHRAGLALVLGLAGALWSASGYVGAFSRASNAIYEVDEGRPFYKLRPVQVLITLICVLLIALVAGALVVTGPVARAIGDTFGLGGAAVTAWDVAKWPVMALVVSVIFSLLYFATPNVKQPRFRWFSIGGVVALLAWVIASAGFAFFAAHFSSYNRTYGSLAAVVVLLVWLWISNLALLFGAELNAEMERAREIRAGLPGAEQAIQLPPRDTAKLDGPPASEVARDEALAESGRKMRERRD